MKRQFFLTSQTASKFWTIEVVKTSVVTTHGRIGNKPRETAKKCESAKLAKQEAEKLIAAKTKKGYQEGSAPIRDEVLGQVKHTIRVNPQHDEYEARVKLGTRKVDLTLYSDEHLAIGKTITKARKLAQDFEAVDTRLRKYLEKNVLPDVNQQWRKGKRPLTAEQLHRKLRLMGVVIHADGRATFDYEAGDLLGYHDLSLEGRTTGTIEDFETIG